MNEYNNIKEENINLLKELENSKGLIKENNYLKIENERLKNKVKINNNNTINNIKSLNNTFNNSINNNNLISIKKYNELQNEYDKLFK